MKKNVIYLFVLICSFSLFVSCKDDNDPAIEKAAPAVEWALNPNFDAVEIKPDMTGQAIIRVKAEAGIKDFKLNIASDVLTDEALKSIQLSANMDLINDENVVDVLSTFKIPVGADLKDATVVNFDISSLVPMILTLQPTQAGNHVFTLKVTDNNERTIEKAVTFHYTLPSSFTVSDINLWMNSATVSVKDLPDGAKIQYRLKNETDWKDVALNDGKYTIGATWTKSTNDAGLVIYNVDTKSGVFAGHAYELRAVKGEEEVGRGNFTTNAGDTIPNGNMSAWSEKEMSTKQVPYPNAEGQSFWDSGNNAFTQMSNTPLCSQGVVDDASTAVLKSAAILGSIFAAGNMFTGTFVQPGMTGDANFGAAYSYTARPVALKLRYKAEVDTCNFAGSYDPQGDEYKGKKIDEARIFVAITDWSARHTVTSGMTDPTPTIWDPAKQSSTSEGDILAYASTFIGEDTNGWVELTLPISWYVKEAAMPTQEFSLVLSFATSGRGDYLTGCSTNKLCIDDIQWVY